MYEQQQIPANYEAEQAVVGALIIGGNVDELTTEVNLTPNDFYFSDCKLVYKCILYLNDKNDKIDIVTVDSTLKTAKEYKGIEFLKNAISNNPTKHNLIYYGKIVKEYAKRRWYIDMSNEILAMAGNTTLPIEKISDQVEYMLATESDSINVNTADDLIMQTYDTIAKASENKGSIPGQATGFDNIDLKMGGIDGLAVLGARPGMGKTAFALNVAEHIVYNELKPVVFFSLEMGAQQLMLRLVSSMTRIKYSALRYGELEDDDWTKLASFMNQSEKTKKLLICDEPKMTVRKIRSVCRRLKKQYGSLGAVIVDYLQLIEMPNNKNCTKAQAVGDVSRELKILTKELGCPIIALSQLNRANEQRSDKRPTLADLRDSGAIEQDADSVMFIHNEDAYRKDKSQPPTGKVEILLPKSRFSQTGTMFLKFQPEYMKFSNWNVKKDPFNRSKNSAAVWDKPDENDKENAKTGEAEKEEK